MQDGFYSLDGLNQVLCSLEIWVHLENQAK